MNHHSSLAVTPSHGLAPSTEPDRLRPIAMQSLRELTDLDFVFRGVATHCDWLQRVVQKVGEWVDVLLERGGIQQRRAARIPNGAREPPGNRRATARNSIGWQTYVPFSLH